MLALGLIGMMGIGLLLIPSHLSNLIAVQSQWVVIFLGVFAFSVAKSIQVVSLMEVPQNRVVLLRSIGIFFLVLFGVIYARNEHFIEALIFLCIAILQFILITPLRNNFGQIDLQQACFMLIGFFSGIYFALSGNVYAGVDITPYRVTLAVMFLGISVFKALTISKSPKNPLISRMQAVPWLVWGAVFTTTRSAANLIPAALICAAILLEGFMPWEKLHLSEDNILGRRILMIVSTLEIALLVFLGAVLIVDVHSFTPPDSMFFVTPHEAALLFFLIISSLLNGAMFLIILVINGLMNELNRMEVDERNQPIETDIENTAIGKRLTRYIKPFLNIQKEARYRLLAQIDQVGVLSQQLKNEKKRNAQLTLLLELSQQLESQLDQPVAAQLAVNSLERALGCSLVSLYIHEPDQKEFMLLAAAGQQTSLIPAGFRQKVTEGALGRAARQRKTQIINDIELDAEYIRFEHEQSLSAVIIPLIFNGHMNGVIVLNSEKINAFTSIDIGLAEAVAAELTRAWERSSYHHRLMNLVQAGSQLSAMVEPAATTREIATIAREILQARFTFVQIKLGQERNFTESAYSGVAPRLLESLEESVDSESLIHMAFNAVQPFRVRDVRKYSSTSHLVIDNAVFRSMLAIPIRWHRLSIGVILAFGKQNEVFFNENDESLAELLSIQAAGAFESTWLQQELRTSLRTTSLLYRLSNQIIQAGNLRDAATDIALTAHKLTKSITTGIILFNSDGNMAAEVEVTSEGVQSQGTDHPMEIIRDVMVSGQLIYLSRGQSIMRACLPIQTPIRTYGAVWMDIPENQGNKHAANPNDLQALASQTAIALERSLLLVESQRQAVEIKAAYDMLESTYDQTLAALMSALDARDRETEGHSLRVNHLAAELGKELNFSHEQLKVLERGSLLHDIGKIGISDTILHKPGPLNEDEWKIMKQHPDIGARIVAGIPFLQDTIPLIRHHQERWNGTGYPGELNGEEIPILARMFAIVDAFDALTSKRPYRERTMTTEEALDYLRTQAGILFDPKIVGIFAKLVTDHRYDLPAD